MRAFLTNPAGCKLMRGREQHKIADCRACFRQQGLRQSARECLRLVPDVLALGIGVWLRAVGRVSHPTCFEQRHYRLLTARRRNVVRSPGAE
jgi:hypothetical protein